MKYSEALPKISYPSTIGSFNIVDFTSYYKVDSNNIEKNYHNNGIGEN